MDRGGGQHTLIGKIIARKGMRLMDFMEESVNFIAMKRFLCGDACGHPMSWSKLQAHHCWQKPHLFLQNVRKLHLNLEVSHFQYTTSTSIVL
uniref:F-box family protein n=1 Tax=Solanum tuberosum TaxID=4113 RepID=M1AK51_SOLTU